MGIRIINPLDKLIARPAIIPNMDNSMGNKKLSIRLWKSLWISWHSNRDIATLAKVAEMYLLAHPQRFNAISETLRHFNLIEGINADSPQEHQKMIDEYFGID